MSGIIHAHSDAEVMRNGKLASKDSKWIKACENYVELLTGETIVYWDILDRYRDCIPELVGEYEAIGKGSAEKLTIVRLMIMRDASLCDDSYIMKRFVDEACHIGGSYLYQLDEKEFDQVPFYVIQWCDEVVGKAKAKYCGMPEQVCVSME